MRPTEDRQAEVQYVATHCKGFINICYAFVQIKAAVIVTSSYA